MQKMPQQNKENTPGLHNIKIIMRHVQYMKFNFIFLLPFYFFIFICKIPHKKTPTSSSTYNKNLFDFIYMKKKLMPTQKLFPRCRLGG